MGLLKHLLFWPVTGPTFLTRFALGKVGDTVREELTDDEAIREELLALQMRVELGEIDDEEYVREETLLMQRLRDVRAWREEFGMATPGGAVRVAADTAAEAGAREESASTTSDRAHDPDASEPPSAGGVASPQGADVEIRLDWD